MKQRPSIKPPAPKQPALTDAQVRAMAEERLADPNYGKPKTEEATKAPPAPPAAAPAETPAEPEKTPPVPAPDAPVAKKPWEQSTERGKGLNFQPDELLHAKMNWVCDNVPRMSRLRILRDGAMAECDRLIAIHYKGE
jgi:hypothetical protein